MKISQFRSHLKQRRSRKGATMTELLVAGMMVAFIMSFITTLCVRVSQTSKDVGHHRVAVAELANQLERLTMLAPEEVKIELEKLEASSDCKRTLAEPKIEGTMSETKIGTQVNLKIDWTRRHPGKAVELVGWIVKKNEKRGPDEQ